MNTVVIGAQWGDEGKGKVVDYLSNRSDLVIRFQGGNNAGHTVYKDGSKYVMHLIPSGILEKKVQCLIGHGVVVDPQELLTEIQTLEKQGIQVRGRLFVSERCHLIFPYHKVLDRVREESRGVAKIGTTGRGIGPCYSDRALRTGLRVGDLFHREYFRQQLALSLSEKNTIFSKIYQEKEFDANTLFENYAQFADQLKPYVADTFLLLQQAMKKKKRVLFEGAQGTLLDLDQGTYPYVTSSATVSGGACVGAGVPPNAIGRILGVAKAYTTRVGEGPLPTAFDDAFMDHMRQLGQEFGATTGRARRCGWFDAVAVRYAVQVNGIDQLILTKLDVLDTLDEIKVCVRYELDGKKMDWFPSDIDTLSRIRPIYQTFKGWREDTGKVRSCAKLPPNAMKYVRGLSKLVGTPISMISVGKEREQIFSCRIS